MPTAARWALIVGLLAGVPLLLRWTVFRPDPVPVEVFVVERGPVEETVTNSRAGAIRSRRDARVSPPVAGRVVGIPHREGERVAEGDVLLVLDDAEARESLALAERELATAEALVAEAQANLDDVERELRRSEGLLPAGAVSPEQVDRLRSRRDALAAQLQAARARVEQQQRAVDLARARLEKHVLRAPFDGVIAERLIEVGEWAVPGVPAFRLVDTEALYVRVELDEVDIARVRAGLSARVSLDPLRGREFAARVVRVAPHVSEAERQNRTLDVDLEFIERPPGEVLKVGVSADAVIVLDRVEDVLRIPAYALLEGGAVYVVNEGHAVKRRIETGLRNWEFVEVRSGLEAGARVILSLDREDLREGARVRVAGTP
jgi:HlyD family secretion protein